MKNANAMDIHLEQYDDETVEAVYNTLFVNPFAPAVEDALWEIPAASYDLVVRALALMLCECRDRDKYTMQDAVSLVIRLRDAQKLRETEREEGRT